MPASAREAESAGSLGDIPLVVLTAGNPTAQRIAQQESIVRLSTRGEHRISTEPGHWVQLDDPEFVIAAICDVLAAVRRTQQENATANKRR